jgi:thioredoxin-like negative regulator of GroEL
MKPVIEVNEANFKNDVLHSTQPVIVDFRAVTPEELVRDNQRN